MRACLLRKSLNFKCHQLICWILAVFALTGCQHSTGPVSKSFAGPIWTQTVREPAKLSSAAPDESVRGPSGESLWPRLRDGFKLTSLRRDNDRIVRQSRWLDSNPGFVRSASQQGSRYLYYIVEQLEQRGMPTELALLPMIESGYNPQALSPAHAAGLWQFIPSTGAHFALTQTALYDGRRDVTASTRAALDYLSRLHGQFGDWLLALAAYNAGEGRIAKAIQANRSRGLPSDYWSLSLPKETQDYVPRLLALANLIEKPQASAELLAAVPNRPYFTQVQVEPGLDLAGFAARAGVAEKELHQLNPAYAWHLGVAPPATLLVPSTQAGSLVDVTHEALPTLALKRDVPALAPLIKIFPLDGDAPAQVASR